MRRTSRRKWNLGARAKAEEEKEEEEKEAVAAAAAAPRRSGKKSTSKTLSQIFQELEEQAVKEIRQPEEPSAGEEASSASAEGDVKAVERDTKAGKRSCPRGPRGLRGDEAAPGPSDLREPGESGPLENFVVFHCLDCFAVLGDSVHLCGEETRLLSVLIFSRITHKVFLDKSLMVGIEGALLGSTYNLLFCHSCGLCVGFRLYSTYATLSDLKGLFCLFKNRIVCYFLKTKSMVNASEIEFPTKHLNTQISKLKEKIMMMDSNLATIIENLKRINNHGSLDVELD